MTASLARLIGFAFVTTALLACASVQTEPRYAEYSLNPSRYPDSIECFYECLGSTREEFRDACLSHCDGVVATTTATPCVPSPRTLCRSYEIEEEPADDESDGEAAATVLDVVSLAVEVATDSRHDDEERSGRRSHEVHETAKEQGPRWGTKPSVSSPKSKLGSKSRIR